MRSCILAVLGLLAIAACSAPAEKPRPDEFARELPPGELGLVPLPANEPIPDFSRAWGHRAELSEATSRSLAYLAAPSSQNYFPYGPITHDHMRASLERFQELLETSTSSDAFRASLVSEFEVWKARGRNNSGEVLFTGYCTPVFAGSLERTGRFQHPIYALPSDLVKGEGGAILGRRTADDQIVPYYSREELRRNNHLQGLELAWLEDPFDVYTAHVQGSAIIDLVSGERMEVGYAGKNGHEYQSVGQALIDSGKVGRDELSLTRLQQFFRDNPQELGPALDVNPSFVFFRRTGGGPFGSLGQTVTAERSLATDKTVFPRAGIVFAEVRLPDFDENGRLVQRPFRFFALDQDTGGAIRSAGRCDVYLGTGDQAVARAGHVLSVGSMYYLFLRGTGLAK